MNGLVGKAKDDVVSWKLFNMDIEYRYFNQQVGRLRKLDVTIPPLRLMNKGEDSQRFEYVFDRGNFCE